MYCKKCLIGRSTDVLGEKCQTVGCSGIIEEEPTYLSLVDTLSEPITCGRRMQGIGSWEHTKGLDRWHKFKLNGNRVCSFCGSLHPDDLFALINRCISADPDASYQSVVEIEPSDKKYKVYVRQPGVRNAMEGGIKFYMQHLPRDKNGKLTITKEQDEAYAYAIRLSAMRFEQYMKTVYI